MFLTDTKLQVSKILTEVFFGAKNGPKINFFRKKSPNVAFFEKWGWLVGLFFLIRYFSARMSGKIFPRIPCPPQLKHRPIFRLLKSTMRDSIVYSYDLSLSSRLVPEHFVFQIISGGHCHASGLVTGFRVKKKRKSHGKKQCKQI